jgi:tetratricopeptide (TPR) repeat protein
LLEDGLYHADGQILDEVYVYGSFLQSKMYRKGVVCADCHDPHSLELNGSGNAPCAGCHLTTKFDTEAHHFHDPVSEAGRCTACHMPQRIYMGVDERADHSFRVPRPDMTVAIGTPNACADCHADRTAGWAADAIAGWRGPGYVPAPHFGTALHAGRAGLPGAVAELARLARDPSQPAIARATALASLGSYGGELTAVAVAAGARDDDAMVRFAALDAAEALPAETLVRTAAPLLSDPVRQVRMTAARVLAPVGSEHLTAEQRPALERAVAEYVESQLVNGELAASHVNLGTLYAQRREYEQAEQSFETALRIDAEYVPGYVNFADLYRARGQDDRCEEVLRQAVEVAPEDGDVRHSLGLTLVRQQRYREAIEELERAVQLRPDRARYSYVLGVALNDLGQGDRALAVLRAGHERHPADRGILFALASMLGRAGERKAGLEYAELLLDLAPQDPGARQLVVQLRAPGN